MLVKNQSGQHTHKHIYRHIQHTHTHTQQRWVSWEHSITSAQRAPTSSLKGRFIQRGGSGHTHWHTHTHTQSLRLIYEKPYLGKTTAIVLKANIFFTQHRIEHFFLRWIFSRQLCLDVKKMKVPERVCQFDKKRLYFDILYSFSVPLKHDSKAVGKRARREGELHQSWLT